VHLNVRWVVPATLLALLAAAPRLHAQDRQVGGMMSSDTTGPTALRFKGLYITPVGYFAGEAVFRSRNNTSDMASSFNSIPYGNTTEGRLTEFRGSARQSRLGLKVEGSPTDQVKLTGYFESDFLVAGANSNSNESNSYALRVRQFFGQAAFKSGFTISSGQEWSLLTTSKRGAENLAQDTPPTIDAQYVPGFDWARQWALRISQSFAERQVTVALAAEEPQMTLGGHGGPSTALVGAPGNSNFASTTNYSTDLAPDLIFKLAFDPKGIGHFEIKALGREFRDRIVDTTVAQSLGGTRTAIRPGGGIGVGVFLPIVPHYVDLTLSGLWGAGIGRYGTSQLPDVILRPNGTVAPLLAAHALAGIDVHATRKLDAYLWGGLEYAYRQVYQNASGADIGYGVPTTNNAGCDQELAPSGNDAPVTGSCSADTRVIWQITPGFWYKFYQGSTGTFQWGLQYSYTQKNTWSGKNGYAPLAIDQMGFTSIRYYWP
jgi:hypothetical protein